jgi:hypothetical protein
MRRNGFVWSKRDQRARCPRRKHWLADDFISGREGAGDTRRLIARPVGASAGVTGDPRGTS